MGKIEMLKVIWALDDQITLYTDLIFTANL